MKAFLILIMCANAWASMLTCEQMRESIIDGSQNFDKHSAEMTNQDVLKVVKSLSTRIQIYGQSCCESDKCSDDVNIALSELSEIKHIVSSQ